MNDQFDIVINPDRPQDGYWRDIWAHRELLWFLVWRNILVRYKQTAVGILWTVLRPLLLLGVFTIIFGRVVRLAQYGETPYALLVFCGLIPWFFFSAIVAEGSTALIVEAQLVSKIYFPRMVIPLSNVIAGMVDFLIMLLLLGLLMAFMDHVPPQQVVALPLIIVMLLVNAFGVGLLFGSWNVRYRDFSQLVVFLLQVGLFASPVIYSSAMVPDVLRLAYFVNPMAGTIDGFRWALLGEPLYVPGLMLSVAVTMSIFALALNSFRKSERGMVDFL